MKGFANLTLKQNAGAVNKLSRAALIAVNLFVALHYAKSIGLRAHLTEEKSQSQNASAVAKRLSHKEKALAATN